MFVLRKLGLGGAALILLLSVVMPGVANAQTPPLRPPLNLTTSPLPLNVITKPGQTVTADIRVKNNGTQAEQLKVELLKFGASGDTGRPQLQERDPQDLYFNWVTFSETNFRAEPNVWKTVKMTINAPKEAAFGYYFAVLFTRSNPDRPTAGASGVEGGVASLVLLNVEAPGARREAKVAEIVATQKVYEFLPAKFKIRLRNAGNIHVAPAGSLFIKRGSAQVGAVNFNVERGNILPGTDRVFELAWNEGFPAYQETTENGKTTQELKWDFGEVQKLRFGKYTANLVAVYDDGQRDVPVEAVVSFWVIPWRIIGGILLIILIIGFGIWAMLRGIWRNIRRQAATMPDEPEESSLAAALKRDKKKAKQRKRTARKEEAQETDSPEEKPREHQSKKERFEEKSERPAKAETTAPVRSESKVTQDDKRHVQHPPHQKKNAHHEGGHKNNKHKSRKHRKGHKGKKYNG